LENIQVIKNQDSKNSDFEDDQINSLEELDKFGKVDKGIKKANFMLTEDKKP